MSENGHVATSGYLSVVGPSWRYADNAALPPRAPREWTIPLDPGPLRRAFAGFAPRDLPPEVGRLVVAGDAFRLIPREEVALDGASRSLAAWAAFRLDDVTSERWAEKPMTRLAWRGIPAIAGEVAA